MKMFRKLVSIVAAATVLTSSLAFSFSANAAEVDVTAAVASEPNLQANAGDGVILHAFNWSYNSIKENLPQIAAAGYSTVQTSPVTQPKNYGMSSDVANQWWKLYQPVSLSIAQSSWLGTKDELTSLCAEADKYGIKIIVDIVANHMANNVSATGVDIPDELGPEVATYEPTLYNNYSTYFHTERYNASDSSAETMTRGHVSACPDLNTGNETVQNKILALLKDCIDCGVDGFRFDAAKHIETEADGSVYSQFWAKTLDVAAQYYKSKTGADLFAYGEILNTIAGRNLNAYTKRMRVTDNKAGDTVLAGVNRGSASSAASTSYPLGAGASKSVIWAESHDTYMGESGSAGLTNTAGVSDDKVVKAWAIVAARQGAAPLYFARPGSSLMGEAAGDLTYKSTVVSEVNKFHNAFAGVSSEKVGVSGNVVYVARGNSGIVLSNINGTTANVSVSGTGLADGSYVDTVTGNQFTVSGGTLSGSIGGTGVAVVYHSTATPKATASVESGSFTTDTMTVQLALENAVSGTYALEDSAPVAFTGTPTIRIGSDYAVGETITLNLTATDAAGNSATNTYFYQKKAPTSSGIYVFLKKSLVKRWTNVHCYIYDEDTSTTTDYVVTGWPGMEMQEASADYYYVEVPARCLAKPKDSNNTTESDFDLPNSPNTYVIFNGTQNGSTTQYPASNALSSQKIKLQGSTHVLDAFNSSGWKTTDMKPTVVEVEATDVTKGNEEPVTDPPTEPTEPTQPATKFVQQGIYGDVDENGVVNIEDVSAIQRHIAEFTPALSGLNKLMADVDQDGDITIKDVSYIQMFLAEYTSGYYHTNEPYGEYVVIDPDAEMFSVNAKSNLFATNTTKLDADTSTFTVTYSAKSEKSLLSADWLLTYDNTVLQPVANQLFMPKAGGATYNPSPASAPNGGVAGNVSTITLVPLLTEDNKQVPVVSATFRVLKAQDTEVNLNVKDMIFSKLNPGEGTSKAANETDVVENGTIGKPDAAYTLYTSVYSGSFNETYTNPNDPTVVYTPDSPQPPTEPTQPTDPAPVGTRRILFTNNKGWDAVYIHYWGSSLGDTTWPGVPMNLCDHDDGFGNPQYYYDVPDDITNMVFNDGNSEGGQQTEDVTYDDSTSGWYPTDEQDDDGHWVTDSWISEEPDPVIPTDPVPPSDTKTIEFTDNKGWGTVNIYIYAGGELAAWPGFGMNVKGDNGYGGTNFVYDVPTNAEFIIFSNADGTDQTVNVPFDSSVTGWYPTEEKDDEGHWYVESWGSGGEITGGTRNILFTDNKGWGTAYIHYWGSDSGDTAWPGVPMTAAGTNGYGEPQYSFNIPTDVDGMVFNNGVAEGGDQTTDVYYDNTTTGWYPLDSKDEQGHWQAAGWTQGGSDTNGFYLVGYFDGEDYWGLDHPFVNGQVTVNFSQTSYAFIRDEAGNAYMTNGFAGEDATSAILYSTDVTGEKSDKLIAHAGQVTFTLVNNGDGTFTLRTGAGGDSGSKTITFGVIEYFEERDGYQIHWWDDNGNYGDADCVSTGTTVMKYVGYWDTEQKFYTYTAQIPSSATGFRPHKGEFWPGENGPANASSAYLFNYDGDKVVFE